MQYSIYKLLGQQTVVKLLVGSPNIACLVINVEVKMNGYAGGNTT